MYISRMGNKEACGVGGNTFLVVRFLSILPKIFRSSLCIGIGVNEYFIYMTFKEKEIAMPIAYTNDTYSSQSSTYNRVLGR